MSDERTNQPTNHTTQAQLVGKLSKDCLNDYVRRRLWGDEMDDILSIFRSINDTCVSNDVVLRDHVKQEGLADAKVTRDSP